MSLDAYWLAFIGTLIGVVGTGVGVLAALIPTTLTGKRDYFQRLASMWSLLSFEARTISTRCKSYKNPPPDPGIAQDKVPLMLVAILSPLPLTAWQAVSANGEFITSLPKKLLLRIFTAYASTEDLNATINFYSLYTSTAAMMNHSFPNTEIERVKDAFALLLKKNDEVIQVFTGLEDLFTHHCEINQQKAKVYEKWIFWLSLTSGVLFVVAIAACITLGILLYIYR